MYYMIVCAIALAESVCNTKTITRISISEPDIEIFWEHPTCRGWTHILSYNVTHCSDSGCVQYQFSNDTTSARLVLHSSTRHSVKAIAINMCLESTTILEYYIEGRSLTKL